LTPNESELIKYEENVDLSFQKQNLDDEALNEGGSHSINRRILKITKKRKPAKMAIIKRKVKQHRSNLTKLHDYQVIEEVSSEFESDEEDENIYFRVNYFSSKETRVRLEDRLLPDNLNENLTTDRNDVNVKQVRSYNK
jgi:hypothetical protein